MSDDTVRRALRAGLADKAAADEIQDKMEGTVAITALKVTKFGLGLTPVVQQAALTAQLTTLTPADAEGTPDYATAAITNTTPFGFASAQEAITVLYVIKNLQTRLAEVEARLEAFGLVAAN